MTSSVNQISMPFVHKISRIFLFSSYLLVLFIRLHNKWSRIIHWAKAHKAAFRGVDHVNHKKHLYIWQLDLYTRHGELFTVPSQQIEYRPRVTSHFKIARYFSLFLARFCSNFHWYLAHRGCNFTAEAWLSMQGYWFHLLAQPCTAPGWDLSCNRFSSSNCFCSLIA